MRVWRIGQQINSWLLKDQELPPAVLPGEVVRGGEESLSGAREEASPPCSLDEP